MKCVAYFLFISNVRNKQTKIDNILRCTDMTIFRKQSNRIKLKLKFLMRSYDNHRTICLFEIKTTEYTVFVVESI